MSTFTMPGDFELRSAPKTEMKWALVASVVLHLLVFAWFALTTMYGSVPSAQSVSDKPMTATLIFLPPPPGNETGKAVATADVSAAATAQVMQPKVTPSATPSTNATSQTAKSMPSKAIATPATTSNTPVAKFASAEPVASTAPVAQTAATGHGTAAPLGVPGGTGQSEAAGAKAQAPAAPGASSPDGDKLMNEAIAAYRRAFLREVADAKQYPQAARRAGYSGRVTLTVTVSHGAPRAEVTGQSSIEELDEMAMKMARQAMQETKVPDVLRTAEFSFRLPVVFQLID